MGSLARWWPWAALFVTPFGVAFRFDLLSTGALAASCALAFGFVTTQAVRARLSSPGLLKAALRLDESHSLNGRLSGALSFSGFLGNRGDAGVDAGFAALVIEEARALPPLSPVGAVPLRVPSGFLFGAGMSALFMLLVLLPFPSAPLPGPLPPPASALQKNEWVSADDAQLLQRSATELTAAVESDEAKEAAERFNELVLRASSGEISQNEAFRLAAELEADLEAGAARSQELREGLKERGEKLEQRKITRQLGEALAEGRVKDAEEALRKFSERLSSDTKSLEKKELEELRTSLEELRKNTEEQTNTQSKDRETSDSDAEAGLQKERDRLLQKKNAKTASKSELERLSETERQLKRLSRKRKSEQAKKNLSELDKQLSQAARELSQEAKKSGEFLDQAADTLKEGQKQQLSDKEKREILKQLKALKERLRRQNQEGDQAKRLREFQKRASGQSGRQQKGEDGKEGTKQGQKRGPGSLSLGPGDTQIPIDGQGKEPGENNGAGEKPGHAHDPHLEGEASKLSGAGSEDKTAVAQDSGQGQSASETILSVAEGGFQAESYEKLYQEYHTVFEEVMEKESVPQGRKAHVMRYFELIRPRGDDHPAKGKQ